MANENMSGNGAIPRFTITLPREDDLNLSGALRGVGAESVCVHPNAKGTLVTVIGVSFEEALKCMRKEAAIALARIRLAETMATETNEES